MFVSYFFSHKSFQSKQVFEKVGNFRKKAFDRIDNTPEKADGFLFDCGKRHIVCTAEFCVCFR